MVDAHFGDIFQINYPQDDSAASRQLSDFRGLRRAVIDNDVESVYGLLHWWVETGPGQGGRRYCVNESVKDLVLDQYDQESSALHLAMDMGRWTIAGYIFEYAYQSR